LSAALFLGESVGWRRWIAILIGLLGVMIIIRPGFEGFNTYTLYIAAAVVMVTFRDLVTRRFSKQTPTLMVNLFTNLATIPLGLLMLAPSTGWQPMQNLDLAFIVLGAITIIVASQTIILAMRTAEISSIAPLRYIALPIAIAYGFFIFGDVPDIWMIIGSAIVVCMGIYTFHRERVLKQKAQA
jgi:drug/metabolite transporter (DMT)-like permease